MPAMTDTDLLFTPAVQAANLIRNRKLSPVEYLDAVLKATERANPVINCFREVMVDQARPEAKKAEEAVTRGEKLGPLHGVPISVKDLRRRRGRADPPWLGDLRGQRPGRCRRSAGAAPARRRCGHLRQGDDARVRRQGTDRRPVWRHAQSVEPGTHAGRLQRRRRGRGGRGPRPPLARHRRRGLGARSCLLLGPGRPQADAGRRALRHHARRLRQQHLCRARWRAPSPTPRSCIGVLVGPSDKDPWTLSGSAQKPLSPEARGR